MHVCHFTMIIYPNLACFGLWFWLKAGSASCFLSFPRFKEQEPRPEIDFRSILQRQVWWVTQLLHFNGCPKDENQRICVGIVGCPQFLQRTWLVGGLERFLFFHILGIIIPIDWYFSDGWLNHQPDDVLGALQVADIEAAKHRLEAGQRWSFFESCWGTK